MILHGKKDNILIPHLYYSGLYQNEKKMRCIQRDKYCFGCNQPLPQNRQNGGSRFPVNIGN